MSEEYSKVTIALAIAALYWRMKYIDSNPEVGMGPWIEHVLDDVEKDTGANFDADEKELILKRVKHKLAVK
jgi:hypothetical protein